MKKIDIKGLMKILKKHRNVYYKMQDIIKAFNKARVKDYVGNETYSTEIFIKELIQNKDITI